MKSIIPKYPNIFFTENAKKGMPSSVNTKQSKYVKYRGPILRVTSLALGSDDLNLDQSAMSIQILPEPNAVT